MAALDDIFFCPCHPSEGCIDRKPGVGLFEQAESKYSIDKSRSYMIGDKENDIIAGNRFGVNTILVYSKSEDSIANFSAKNITQAVDWIINNE